MANDNEIAQARELLKAHRKEKLLSVKNGALSYWDKLKRVRLHIADPKPVVEEKEVLDPDTEMQCSIESDAQDPTVNTQEVN